MWVIRCSVITKASGTATAAVQGAHCLRSTIAEGGRRRVAQFPAHRFPFPVAFAHHRATVRCVCTESLRVLTPSHLQHLPLHQSTHPPAHCTGLKHRSLVPATTSGSPRDALVSTLSTSSHLPMLILIAGCSRLIVLPESIIPRLGFVPLTWCHPAKTENGGNMSKLNNTD